jgi:hypothetical protein
LVSLAQPRPEPAPRLGVAASRLRARHGGRFEQRAGLLAVVLLQRDLRLALPGLPGHDAAGHAHRAGHRGQHRGQPCGGRRAGPRQHLEGQHDERIPGQHRQAFAEGAVHRGLAAACGRVVEAGQVVVHERGAVQQLQRHRGGVTQRGLVVAAGPRHGQAQPRPYTGAAREHGVSHGGGQQGRAAGRGGGRQGGLESLFDAGEGWHGRLRRNRSA